MDAIETYRELAGGLMDVYLSSIGNRQNEVMKVLTIMASIFIPLTFMAGIYGMNFQNMPELEFRNWALPDSPRVFNDHRCRRDDRVLQTQRLARRPLQPEDPES